MKTTNSGDSWNFLDSGLPPYYGFDSPFFINENIGWVCGNNGIILKTTNAGENWMIRQVSGGNPVLRDIVFINENVGLIAGEYRILKTIDGGNSWSTYWYDNGNTAVSFFDNGTAYMVGDYSGYTKIIKTTNFGDNWTLIGTPSAIYYELLFLNSDQGYAVGYGGLISSTTNGGLNWNEIFVTMNNLWGIAKSPSSLYAVGSNGTILKKDESSQYTYCGNNNKKVLVCHNGHTICVSINSIPAHLAHGDYLGNCGDQLVTLPTEFELKDNYPNPFNPMTRIDYNLPFDSKVSIQVFDAVGREVATLVNDNQKAGYYSVDFNASNLASGIYFYRMIAGDFRAIKKMVVIK